MKSVRFLDVWLNADTDDFHVDTTVKSLNEDDVVTLTTELTDMFVNSLAGKSEEEIRAIQTMLLSFAAGVAAASKSSSANVEYFDRLVKARMSR